MYSRTKKMMDFPITVMVSSVTTQQSHWWLYTDDSSVLRIIYVRKQSTPNPLGQDFCLLSCFGTECLPIVYPCLLLTMPQLGVELSLQLNFVSEVLKNSVRILRRQMLGFYLYFVISPDVFLPVHHSYFLKKCPLDVVPTSYHICV